MYESLKYYTNWNKPDAKRQILYDSICMRYSQIHRQKIECWVPRPGERVEQGIKCLTVLGSKIHPNKFKDLIGFIKHSKIAHHPL